MADPDDGIICYNRSRHSGSSLPANYYIINLKSQCDMAMHIVSVLREKRSGSVFRYDVHWYNTNIIYI